MSVHASLLVAIASLLASTASAGIALAALRQTTRIANRDRMDWLQRKWFELYFEADRAYDALDRFQTLYQTGTPLEGSQMWAGFVKDRNDLMFALRRTYSMAVVFPKNTHVDKLLESTKMISVGDEIFSKQLLHSMFDAIDGIRSKALIRDIGVIG